MTTSITESETISETRVALVTGYAVASTRALSSDSRPAGCHRRPLRRQQCQGRCPGRQNHCRRQTRDRSRWRRRGRERHGRRARCGGAGVRGVDVVGNTAGIMTLSTITELNHADLDRMHRTNIRGTFVIAQQAAAHVRTDGAIINSPAAEPSCSTRPTRLMQLRRSETVAYLAGPARWINGQAIFPNGGIA